jgi:hypothetical protein
VKSSAQTCDPIISMMMRGRPQQRKMHSEQRNSDTASSCLRLISRQHRSYWRGDELPAFGIFTRFEASFCERVGRLRTNDKAASLSLDI